MNPKSEVLGSGRLFTGEMHFLFVMLQPQSTENIKTLNT